MRDESPKTHERRGRYYAESKGWEVVEVYRLEAVSGKMVNLARNLKLRVVAEGAESIEQVHFLWENLCHQVQDFYFSPAVSMEHLLGILEQRAVASM